MSFYIYLLLGILGGIPAGMGMGGGTVTIPLLILVGGVEQKIAQSANLFSFLPMSVGALRVHADNKLLATDGIGWMIVPALAFSACLSSAFSGAPPRFRRLFDNFVRFSVPPRFFGRKRLKNFPKCVKMNRKAFQDTGVRVSFPPRA